MKDDGIDEDRGVRKKGDGGAGFLGISVADDVERLSGFATLEGDAVDFPATRDVRAEPVGKGVHALRTDTVETAGIFVSALAEFSAGVEIG